MPGRHSLKSCYMYFTMQRKNKTVSTVVVTMDMDQEPTQQTLVLHSVSSNSSMPYNNMLCIILMEGGGVAITESLMIVM